MILHYIRVSMRSFGRGHVYIYIYTVNTKDVATHQLALSSECAFVIMRIPFIPDSFPKVMGNM